MCGSPRSGREQSRRCPACVDRDLRKLKPVRGLTVDVCDGRGGLWCDRGEDKALREANTPAGSWRANVSGREAPRCRGCDRHIDRDAHACSHCARLNVVGCPACQRPMEVVTRSGLGRAKLRLDVCATCQGVWFDATECAATRPPGGPYVIRDTAASREVAVAARNQAAGGQLAGLALEFVLEAVLGIFTDV